MSIDSFKFFFEKLLLNPNVHDLNNSFENMKGSTDFYKVSIKCLADGNFILHNWGTNCDELRDFINTQSHPSDEELVKNIVKHLELIGILKLTSLSLSLAV